MANHWDIRVGGTYAGEFWLDRQPVADRAAMGDEAYVSEAVGPENAKRIRHEIYKYDSNINLVQWLDWIGNVGVILAADGRPREGGSFHAWIAGADGQPPREVREIADMFRFPNNSALRYAEVQKRAVLRLCAMTGLPVPDDFRE